MVLAGELDAEQVAAAIPDQRDTELAELMSMLSGYPWRRRLALDVDTARVLVEDDFHYNLPHLRTEASWFDPRQGRFISRLCENLASLVRIALRFRTSSVLLVSRLDAAFLPLDSLYTMPPHQA